MTLQLLVEVAGNPRSLVVLAGLYQHPGGGVQSALARTEHRGLLARLDRPATIADGEIRFGEGHVLARRRIRIIALHIGGEAVAKHTNRIAMPAQIHLQVGEAELRERPAERTHRRDAGIRLSGADDIALRKPGDGDREPGVFERRILLSHARGLLDRGRELAGIHRVHGVVVALQ